MSSPPPNRTVIDYPSVGQLRQALAEEDHDSYCPVNPNEPLELAKTAEWDWTIENALSDGSYDVQSIDSEVQRLMALKSYMALEFQDMSPASRDTFQGLACLAKHATEGAAGLLTLVDLGRQWFLANSESPQAPGETPRKNGFCAHAILCKDPTFVVPDATNDARFADHFLVTDHGLRFYAGVPLITPEGFKIGALCITDGKPRPEGLTQPEEAQLHLLAQLAVHALTAHRSLTAQQTALRAAKLESATAAHNLVTPLTGAQLALSLLADDADLQTRLNPTQRDCLATAQSCTATLQASCHTLRCTSSTRQGSSTRTSIASSMETNHTAATLDETDSEEEQEQAPQESSPSSSSQQPPQEEPQEEEERSTLNLTQMIRRLEAVLPNSSLQVPVTVSLDPELQQTPIPTGANKEAEVFRAALCLLTNACSRAILSNHRNNKNPSTGSVVRLHFGTTEQQGLVLETSDAGPAPSPNDYDRMQGQAPSTAENVVQPFTDLGVVAQRIRTLGGRAGIRAPVKASCTAATATNFYFEIPLTARYSRRLSLPKRKQQEPPQERAASPFRRSKSAPEGTLQHHKGTCRRALVIDDSCTIRKMLAHALKRLNYDVVTACDGAEGVHCLKHQTYTLVFCDFLMPVMDGMDCIRTFRAWETRHRRGEGRQFVCGISAHASPQDVQRALQLGMDTYRDKPLKFADIQALVERIEQGYDDIDPAAQVVLKDESMKKEEWIQQSSPTTTTEARQESQSTCSNNKTIHKESCLVLGANQDTRAAITATLGLKHIQACFAHSDQEALTLLKSRNWTMVLVDHPPPPPTDHCCKEENLQTCPLDNTTNGLDCVRGFRSWERLNRVLRQQHIYLLMDKDELQTHEILPTGVDGVLYRPFGGIRFHKALADALQTSKFQSSATNLRPKDIVTR